MGNTKTVRYTTWLVTAACCLVLLPSPARSQGGTATLTVGHGSGGPGTGGNQITVALSNDVPVGGMQLEVCDEDDYLVCAGKSCTVLDRASGFLCDNNEQPNGCCRIILVGTAGQGLAEGSGPIFTLDYTVATNAPPGVCRGLDLQEVKIADDNQQPLDVTPEPGEFCFSTTNKPCLSKEIYGENSQEIQMLRSIRDNVLRKTPEGRKIIGLYYQWSPAIVEAMKEDQALEAEIRKMLDGFLLLIP